MSMLLYIAGGMAFLAGLAAIAFGSPASALDFGNTLIVAGATSAVGGLIVIGLGAVVSRLQRIADNLGIADAVDHIEPVVAAPRSVQPRPEPRVEPKPFEPRGPSTPPEFPPFMARTAAEPVHGEPAGSLESPLSDASVTDQEPEPAAEAKPVGAAEEPAADLPPKSFFESVWPEEKSLVTPKREPAPEPPRVSEPASAPQSPPEAKKPEAKPRAAAVLKSGVVDGMGYTLYVDGSIEAELPQGTVRFASIQELRSHLEKNG